MSLQIDPSWQPSKYVRRSKRLRASRDRAEVTVGSRLVADLTAAFYEDAIARHARGRLLDLGCGKAPLYGAYAPRVDEVLRVDWGGSVHGSSHVDLAHDLNLPLPVEDDRFDTIIFSDVLEHLPEPEKCWADLARVLAPGGTVILNVPFFYWLHEEPFDFYRYTEHALRRFADRVGLEVVELKPLGGAPEVLLDIVGKVLSRSRLGSSVAATLPGLHAALTRIGVAGPISRATAPSFPLSYAMVVRKPA